GIRDLTVTGVQTCALPISAELLLHRRDDLRKRLAVVRNDLRDHQPGEHAVALRQEVAEADTAALLAADEHVAREHQIGHVLEARSEERRVGKEGRSRWAAE